MTGLGYLPVLYTDLSYHMQYSVYKLLDEISRNLTMYFCGTKHIIGRKLLKKINMLYTNV